MKRLLLFAFVSFLFISCSKDNDENLIGRYAGVWQGTYTGTGDNGTWQVDISTSGVVSGNAVSAVYSSTHPLTGSITENGNMNLTIGTTATGGTFSGQLDHVNGTASGVWDNLAATPPLNGTWVGTKQ